MNPRKKLIIVLNEPYPLGMACTQRIHLYAKGLMKIGVLVKIIVPKPKILDLGLKVSPKGEYEGVPYAYATPSPYRSASFIKRRVAALTGPIKAALVCMKERPDAILLVGGMLYYIVLFKMAGTLARARLLREKSEVPYMEQDKITHWQKWYLKRTFSLFDGIITITDELARYFKEELRLNVETCTIPILIDGMVTDPKFSSNGQDLKYMLYSGSLLDRKDGIMSILKAFSVANKAYPGLKLYITGNAHQSPDYPKVKETIDTLGIQQQVKFKGFVPKRQMFKLQQNALLLILVKPHNRQNQYNFPTKIGEYLSSGTPVLCTENKTLNTYFSNGKNMFLCKNQPEEIGQKIIEILKSPEISKIVGEQGRQYALRFFHYKYQAERLKTFIFHGK